MELEEYAEYIRKAVKTSLPDHLAESKVSIVYGKYWYAHLDFPIDFPHMDTTDFDHIKSRIVARMISSKPQNKKYLKDRPVKYLDGLELDVVWEFPSPFLCYDKDEKIARKPVTYDMLNEWGLSDTGYDNSIDFIS